MWRAMAAVCIGGTAGCLLRWFLGLWLNDHSPVMPLGTLAANLIGGYIVGVAVAFFALNSSIAHEPLSDSNPRITAVISMRLLVVSCSPPLDSFDRPVAGCLRINAHPPGPGLPMHAPSVKRRTAWRFSTVGSIADL